MNFLMSYINNFQTSVKSPNSNTMRGDRKLIDALVIDLKFCTYQLRRYSYTNHQLGLAFVVVDVTDPLPPHNSGHRGRESVWLTLCHIIWFMVTLLKCIDSTHYVMNLFIK